jgi:hypothetical protein
MCVFTFFAWNMCYVKERKKKKSLKSQCVSCVDSVWWYFVLVVRCRLRLELIFQPVGGILLPLLGYLEKSSNLLHRGIFETERELHHIPSDASSLHIYIRSSISLKIV